MADELLPGDSVKVGSAIYGTVQFVMGNYVIVVTGDGYRYEVKVTDCTKLGGRDGD